MRRSLFILSAVALLGCGEAVAPGESLVRSMRTQWRAKALVDYDYETYVSCFCLGAGPVRIAVRDNRVTRVTVVETGADLPTADAHTIDWLFDLALQEIAAADDVKITYDPLFFFPRQISVDQYKQMADDEYTLSAKIVRLGK